MAEEPGAQHYLLFIAALVVVVVVVVAVLVVVLLVVVVVAVVIPFGLFLSPLLFVVVTCYRFSLRLVVVASFLVTVIFGCLIVVLRPFSISSTRTPIVLLLLSVFNTDFNVVVAAVAFSFYELSTQHRR